VRRPDAKDNPEIRARMREIAEHRRRFGYRRIGVLLAREGMAMNKKKLYRLYSEERLTVRKRKKRKRAMGSRTPMPAAGAPNMRWSIDFVSDTFGASRRFRTLAVVDDCTRECIGLVADTSIGGARVTRELDAMMRVYGAPACIVSDNGTEFTSRAALEWQGKTGVAWHSTAACATSASTRPRSSPCPTHAASWRSGGTTTTMSVRTRRWAAQRQRKHAPRAAGLARPTADPAARYPPCSKPARSD